MRAELLRRLDKLIGVLAPWGKGPLDERALRREWQEIRAEIVAERCDACRWWNPDREPVGTTHRCEYIETRMYYDACCSHFEKKS